MHKNRTRNLIVSSRVIAILGLLVVLAIELERLKWDFSLRTNVIFLLPITPYFVSIVMLATKYIKRRIKYYGPGFIVILGGGALTVLSQLSGARAQDILVLPYVAFWQMIGICALVVITFVTSRIESNA